MHGPLNVKFSEKFFCVWEAGFITSILSYQTGYLHFSTWCTKDVLLKQEKVK